MRLATALLLTAALAGAAAASDIVYPGQVVHVEGDLPAGPLTARFEGGVVAPVVAGKLVVPDGVFPGEVLIERGATVVATGRIDLPGGLLVEDLEIPDGVRFASDLELPRRAVPLRYRVGRGRYTSGHRAMRMRGLLLVRRGGPHRFRLTTADSALLFVGRNLVLSAPEAPAGRSTDATVDLRPGWVPVELRAVGAEKPSATLSWAQPGGDLRIVGPADAVPPAALFAAGEPFVVDSQPTWRVLEPALLPGLFPDVPRLRFPRFPGGKLIRPDDVRLVPGGVSFLVPPGAGPWVRHHTLRRTREYQVAIEGTHGLLIEHGDSGGVLTIQDRPDPDLPATLARASDRVLTGEFLVGWPGTHEIYVESSATVLSIRLGDLLLEPGTQGSFRGEVSLSRGAVPLEIRLANAGGREGRLSWMIRTPADTVFRPPWRTELRPPAGITDPPRLFARDGDGPWTVRVEFPASCRVDPTTVRHDAFVVERVHRSYGRVALPFVLRREEGGAGVVVSLVVSLNGEAKKAGDRDRMVLRTTSVLRNVHGRSLPLAWTGMGDRLSREAIGIGGGVSMAAPAGPSVAVLALEPATRIRIEEAYRARLVAGDVSGRFEGLGPGRLRVRKP